MDTLTVETKLTEILRDVFNQPNLQYNPDLTADDVDGWDSLSHVDLIVAVETEFGIKLTTGQVRGLKNVGDFVKVIALKAR
jgi:acyl carrier protein